MDYKRIYELFYGVATTVFPKDVIDPVGEEAIKEALCTQHINDDWFRVPFSVIAAGYYEVGDRHFTQRKDSDFYEIICTIDGCGEVTVGDTVYNCVANTVLIIDCQVPHSFVVKSGNKWLYKHLHIVANDVCSKYFADKAVFCFINDNGAVNSGIDSILRELRHSNAESCFYISNKVSEILTEIIQYQFKSSFTDPQEELVERAVKYIQEHYMEKINIKQLANDEYISPYHFIRLFKKYHGIPPYNYLMEYRLKMAQYLFMHQKSVKEVASECGFSSTNSFSRAFQKHFGISPSQYRETVCGVSDEDFINESNDID
ncbi:MAG: helix-turn-helix transcriptional regulator [Clostridia bacterium]|nr:helix-turn-helix transcriptional regulator [Clostridia bacterium]